MMAFLVLMAICLVFVQGQFSELCNYCRCSQNNVICGKKLPPGFILLQLKNYEFPFSPVDLDISRVTDSEMIEMYKTILENMFANITYPVNIKDRNMDKHFVTTNTIYGQMTTALPTGNASYSSSGEGAYQDVWSMRELIMLSILCLIIMLAFAGFVICGCLRILKRRRIQRLIFRRHYLDPVIEMDEI